MSPNLSAPCCSSYSAAALLYRYLEGELHVQVINSKRVVTVEKAGPLDLQYLEMGDCNCLAVVSSQTYNGDGVMFEYTQSRHHPNYFRFQDNAVRRQGASAGSNRQIL